MESGNYLNKEKTNRMKTIDNYEYIKSKYILKKIFNNLMKRKLLSIIKYNKNIKKRINLDINDFKEYSEKYSSIEIEIKLFRNKYGKFINIKNEEEIYYHIYFNNNKKEIKRNYIEKNEQIQIIKIIIDYQIKSFEKLFDECDCIESIYLKNFIGIILII